VVAQGLDCRVSPLARVVELFHSGNGSGGCGLVSPIRTGRGGPGEREDEQRHEKQTLAAGLFGTRKRKKESQ